MLSSINYNPDVLTCIANLSSDEVFTPPQLANRILDLIPAELWHDKKATFLDPGCKSGVFLREIAKRLDTGLEKQLPGRQKRMDHVFKHQLYGLAITELTALLSRRSVYCSKTANGKYSVCEAFDSPIGNIRFEKAEHTWGKGRCFHCGANREHYDRDDQLERHAYEFIHTNRLEGIFDMKFDVIVGNPPYQLNDGGGVGTSATPIYQHFVLQAKKLKPRYLAMVIPSRWFSGGRGLDDFRDEMLKDRRIRRIVDYPNSADAFPGVDIAGGICIFLWDRDNEGDCRISTNEAGEITSEAERPLLENGVDTFIRFNEAIPILRKVKKRNEPSFSELVSANDPFGFDERAANSFRRVAPIFSLTQSRNAIAFYYNGWSKSGIGFVERTAVRRNADWVGKTKVLVAKAYGERGSYPFLVLAKPFLAERNSCCTETYLVVGPFATATAAANAVQYISTRFFRFLVLLKKNTQNALRGVYSFVPMQDLSERWTDTKLYRKYNLSGEEIAFIESMVRPMEGSDE
ncbi:MAG: Eco57I restriction-modification methylase domain-containing protein [Thermoanaerobaculia bacterium]